MNKIKQWITEFKEFDFTYKVLTLIVLAQLTAGVLIWVIYNIAPVSLFALSLLIALIMKMNHRPNQK